MIRDRIVPVAVSVLVIVLVAIVQERSRYLAAIIATMPLTAPLAMWIVFSGSGGDQRQTAEFVASMAAGFAASMAFLAVCWFGFRLGWGFAVTLVAAGAIWLGLVALARVVERGLR
jgi:uncharacterized membrane protein (GlpM family)